MNILFAVWNLDSADHSMFFVALRSQIYEERPASWMFGSVCAPLLLVRNVLSARCLLAVTRETCFRIGLPRLSPSGVFTTTHLSETRSNHNRSATHNPPCHNASRWSGSKRQAPWVAKSVRSGPADSPPILTWHGVLRWCVAAALAHRWLPVGLDARQRVVDRQKVNPPSPC
jgi:hypothetical protein